MGEADAVPSEEPRTDQVSRVAEHLQSQILSGELAPGDRLPSERDISAQMQVSRSVVREAIGRLASLGLVRSVHGSGTLVEAPSGRLVSMGVQQLFWRGNARMEHLAEVRLPLETAIAAKAALHRTEEHLLRMEAAQRVLASPRRSLEAHVAADLEFHAALAEATGNPLFLTILAPIQELLIESRRRTLGRHGAELAHQHHERILEAVRASDPTAAANAMREHIEANMRHLQGDSPSPQTA